MNERDLLKQFQKNLIDLTARNNLINFKFSSATCFDIEKYYQFQRRSRPNNQSFEIELINNRDPQDLNEKEKLQKAAHKTLGKIYLKQREIKDEKGFNPTSWAYCFFKYKDGDREKYAPIYLISTEVIKNGRGGYGVNHFSRGPLEVIFNHAIYEKFKKDFQINLNRSLTDFGDGEVSINDIDQKILAITNFLNGNVHGISIENKVVIGIFNSAKSSLYNDLSDLEDEFLNHKLVKIFLSQGGSELTQGELSEDPDEIDKISSDMFFSPFDFDSSQLQAIKAAKDGKNFVIQGPPGTGKTQTISNIISELVADGKKVLFVAEKKAAIDAVLRNFSKINLEKIFLDLHHKKSKSKEIVAQVIDSIDFFHYESQPPSLAVLSDLDKIKRKLSARSELLHQKLSFGKKPFHLIFELSQMKNVEKIDCDFPIENSKEEFERCLQILEEAQDLSNIYLDMENPFLNSDVDGLELFREKDKDQKSLIELKNLIIDTKDVGLKIKESDRKILESSKIANNLGLDVAGFERGDDLNDIFCLSQKALLHKNILSNEINPWLKGEIKNPNLFLVERAKELLNSLKVALISKNLKESEVSKMKLSLCESEDGFKEFHFVHKKDFSFEVAINLINQIKKYKSIIYSSNVEWVNVIFKNKCFDNDGFLKEVCGNFDLLIKNINLLSELHLEIDLISKASLSSKNLLKKLQGVFAKKRVNVKIFKSELAISTLKNWILEHFEFDEKNNILEDVKFIEDAKRFFSENEEILSFKILQNKINKAGLEDLFLSSIEKKSDLEYELEILKNIQSKRMPLKKEESLLIIMDKEINNLTQKVASNLFESSYEEGNLMREVDLRLKYIETVPSLIIAKKLLEEISIKIDLLDIKKLWEQIWSQQIDLPALQSLSDNYFRNKSQLEFLNNKLSDNKLKIYSLLEFVSEYLDFKSENINDLNSLENRVLFYIKYSPTLKDSISYLRLIKELEVFGLEDYWNKSLERKVPPKNLLEVFKNSFFSKILENLVAKNNLVSSTESLSAIIDDFKILDKNSIKINRSRIIDSIKKHSSKTTGDGKLQELRYRQRFPKPRKVISKYRDIILDSVGCVVCSPLTICEYFEIKEGDVQNPIFDVVIFDEASQIFTWDAISSIFRSKQMIIAGDTEQMPPTNLFLTNDSDSADFDGDEECPENVNDYKGLLSFAATRLREVQLQWHYRSKFEQLIHPSNQFVYNGRLISFPNADKNEKPIDFHYLPEGIWENSTNDVEAKYLIKLLKEIYQSGSKSVGVIAMNKRQQTLIIDLIYSNDELAPWLDDEDLDGLFVKNLENCQGDERDIIIVCSSYAKNKDGKVDGRMFGQINKDDAYKRLNVMFSRARQKLHLLSSLKWQDVPSQYEGRKGMDFFKSYLRFAETGDLGISSRKRTMHDSFDSGFEESVCKSLRLLGYKIDSQVGCSGYRIDLAAICPNTKNYVLGIECDGEMYHSGKIARERDRLRQEVLESKGWKIHRIWSYDWIHSKNEEIEKLKNKIDQLIVKKISIK